ncbi:DUF1440 domain-containing protein [Candidatus Formimonas warabiya]|nr:DUF1440 domain-containing protein [Candidatus Formimonas warabiya]
MKDRLIAGGLAGIAGAIIQITYGIITEALGITDRSFDEFAKVLIMFKPYKGLLASVVGAISHICIGLVFGVIFAYLILITSSRFLMIKGIGYGAVLWMLLLGFGTIFELPDFKDIPPQPALSIFFGAIIYGSITALTLKYLESRTKL